MLCFTHFLHAEQVIFFIHSLTATLFQVWFVYMDMVYLFLQMIFPLFINFHVIFFTRDSFILHIWIFHM